MPNGRGKNKARNKRRTPKTSRGINTASKHPLMPVERALLGKGIVQSLRAITPKSPWRGVGIPGPPYDAEQAEENKRLYPHLFQEDRRK